ncbi:stage III sporulation protein AG [Bacillus massiliglaciei]|uniref:stage III sporulation protein AG n=1 Tax=Bacillus massiliglaciei TaxID=1816693 RepID=UPI000A953ADA|nr:stage III sporulation protein AG [Bacillus massiliglaciei]
MKNEKGPLSWLQKLLNKEGGQQDKKPSLYVYALIIGLLGIGIMMAGNLLKPSGTEDAGTASSTVFKSDGEKNEENVETFGQKSSGDFKTTREYEIYLQNEMKEALETIAGVEEVKVVVFVDSSEKKVYERNKVTQKQVTGETDKEGGKRTVEDTSVDDQLVIIKNGDKEGPIISETQKPKVNGVLVVAKGAENIQIKKMVVEAVTRALDVPSHRVSVMPKK